MEFLRLLKIFFTFVCTLDGKSDGIYVIIAVKNQENKIEGFLRSILFRILYGKEECMKEIILADLDSTDSTKEIMQKLSNEYSFIKLSNWKDCKMKMDRLNEK